MSKKGNETKGSVSKQNGGGYSILSNPSRISEKTSNINKKGNTENFSASKRSGPGNGKKGFEKKGGNKINQKSNEPKISKRGSFVTVKTPKEEEPDE